MSIDNINTTIDSTIKTDRIINLIEGTQWLTTV